MVIVPLEEVLIICQSGTFWTPIWCPSFQTLQNSIIYLTTRVDPGAEGYPCTPGFFMGIFCLDIYLQIWKIYPEVVRPFWRKKPFSWKFDQTSRLTLEYTLAPLSGQRTPTSGPGWNIHVFFFGITEKACMIYEYKLHGACQLPKRSKNSLLTFIWLYFLYYIFRWREALHTAAQQLAQVWSKTKSNIKFIQITNPPPNRTCRTAGCSCRTAPTTWPWPTQPHGLRCPFPPSTPTTRPLSLSIRWELFRSARNSCTTFDGLACLFVRLRQKSDHL